MATPKTALPAKHVPKNHLPSTQRSLYIAEIKQDTVILKDGTLRAVLSISSINFALKSEDEQQAIIQGYISFLNTLDFNIQVVIQSRKLDITKYINNLSDLAKKQTNELLKVQTQEYKQYIEELITLSEIMEKKFYVVVPYSPFSKKKKNWFSRAEEILLPARIIKLGEAQFVKYGKELERHVSMVAGGLSSIGLQVQMLNTEQLIKLYYDMYNPPHANARPLPDISKLRLENQTIWSI